ncbi:MAG: ribonuclease H-like domain-containing protein [Candidatus Taylorbacteria bacterium]
MRKIVFDIETTNIFQDVGKNDPALLNLAVVGIHDSETNEYSCYEQEELSKLWPILEKADLLVGFNSEHFDIPLLNKYYPGDLRKIKSVDIMKEIKNSFGRRIGLGHIAESTLGVGKSGSGLQSVEWWRRGEKDKVKKYCLQDVKVTKELYEFALKNNYLRTKEGEKYIDIKFDTSLWEQMPKKSVTQTLLF